MRDFFYHTFHFTLLVVIEFFLLEFSAVLAIEEQLISVHTSVPPISWVDCYRLFDALSSYFVASLCVGYKLNAAMLKALTTLWYVHTL